MNRLLHSRLARDFGSLVGPLALISVVALGGAMGSPALERTTARILAYIVIVVGLQVFIGTSGIYSFGHMGLAAIGGYLAAILTLPPAFKVLAHPGLPDVLSQAELGTLASTLLAGAAVGIISLVVAVPLMRTSTLAIPISTLAFLLVVFQIAANLDDITRGTSGVVGIPRVTTVGSAAAWAAVAVLVALIFKTSSIGYRLQATREDEVAARSIGIGVFRERLAAFIISGAVVAVGGVQITHQSGVLTPSTFFFDATLVTLTMLVVGGRRSVFGAVLGAVGVSIVSELLRTLEAGPNLGFVNLPERPGLAPIGLSMLLIAVVIFRPAGIMGSREIGEFRPLRVSNIRRRPVKVGRGSEKSVPSSGRVGEATLEGRAVSVDFAGIRALREVDFALARGEILGLIGPNGAGKTTLINVLSGFQHPNSGAVRLEGQGVTGLPPHRLAHLGLARTFQAAHPFYELTVLENVAVGALGVGASRSESVLIARDVLDRLNLTAGAEDRAGALPLGRQRLLGIGRALATEPRFLLLDEPAAGLNESESLELVAALHEIRDEFGCGILIVDHDMSVIMPLCERIQVVDSGMTLMIGTPEEVQHHPAVIEAYLGTSFVERTST